MMTMAIVESTSVDALAFDYFRFGLYVVVNNLWTLVAVATAAASFWRFKLAPSLDRQRHHVHVSCPKIVAESSPSITRPKVINSNVIPPPLTAECSDDGAVAGNRVYCRFQYDDVIGEEEELVEDEEGLGLVVQGGKTVRFDVLERMRLLDLGIYEHQDMRVLDGNVVKLWDSRVSLSPRATLRPPIVSTAVLVGGWKCSTRQLRIHQ